MAEVNRDINVLQIIRAGGVYVSPGSDPTLQAGDRITVRGDKTARNAFIETFGLTPFPRARITEGELDRPDGRGRLVEAIVPHTSSLRGRTIGEAGFREHYRGTVLALRRGSDITHDDLASTELSEGDGVLVHAIRGTLRALSETGDLLITEVTGPGLDEENVEFERREATVAVGILLEVIVAAALGWLPIVIAALGGLVDMIVVGLLTPRQAYRTVSWEVIFLLAGVIPLGIALQQTGGNALIADVIVGSAAVFHPVVVLGLFYLVTSLLTNVITPVASVV